MADEVTEEKNTFTSNSNLMYNELLLLSLNAITLLLYPLYIHRIEKKDNMLQNWVFKFYYYHYLIEVRK